jgi:hypothetical protein
MKRPVEIAQEISRLAGEEKKITWQAAEKMAARRAVEKTLGNPANPAGLSHSPDDYGRLTKIEHSLFYEKGTLLVS